MYTLVAVSGLLSPSAFVRLPEMRISVLHKGHSILFHLLDFISVFAPRKTVFAAPMAYWSRHLLAWLIARRQAAGACGRGLHPRGFATPHLLNFVSVFAPQKPVFAAVWLHFACGGTALAFLAPAGGMILSHPKDAGKFETRFFDRATRMSFLLLSVATKNQSLFAVGGPGASERGVKKNHDLIRNLKS